MFRIQNENELKNYFRSEEFSEVILGANIHFPLVVKDYLTWVEPSGCRTYLVFKDDSFKAPLGVVFRRDQSVGPSAPSMCEWCHSVRSGNEIGILTVRAHSQHRIGLSLCRDLSCADKIRSEPGVHDFPQLSSPQERLRRLVLKMADFSRRYLV